jgi:hypothetical protein
MLTAQYRKLVAQHQDLDLLGLRRPTAEQDQLEAAAQRQVDERPDHTDLRQGKGSSDDLSWHIAWWPMVLTVLGAPLLAVAVTALAARPRLTFVRRPT